MTCLRPSTFFKPVTAALLACLSFNVGSVPVALANGQRDSDPQIFCEMVLTTPAPLKKSVNSFTFNMIGKMRGELVGQNTFISGLVAAKALDMFVPAARGNTLAEMQRVLGIDPRTTAAQHAALWQELAASMTDGSDPDVKVALASSLWLNSTLGATFHPDFVSQNLAAHGKNGSLPVTLLEFLAPDTIGRINGWVADNTEQMITDLIEEIDGNAVMYAISAIYANLKFNVPFNEELTREENFTAGDGKVSRVNMMRWADKQIRPFTRTTEAEIVSLPYGESKRFVMDVIVPRDGFTLAQVLDSLNEASYDAAISRMTEEQLTLTLPRFDVKYRNAGLKDVFTAMGLKDLTNKKADLSGMLVPSPSGLFVTKAITSGRVRTTEKGTEAAVSVAVEAGLECLAAPCQRIAADHAFAIAIRDTKTGVVMAFGTIDNPGLVEADEPSAQDQSHELPATGSTQGHGDVSAFGEALRVDAAFEQFITGPVVNPSSGTEAARPVAHAPNNFSNVKTPFTFAYPDDLGATNEVQVVVHAFVPMQHVLEQRVYIETIMDKVVTATLNDAYNSEPFTYGFTVPEFARTINNMSVEALSNNGGKLHYRVTFGADLRGRDRGPNMHVVYNVTIDEAAPARGARRINVAVESKGII